MDKDKDQTTDPVEPSSDDAVSGLTAALTSLAETNKAILSRLEKLETPAVQVGASQSDAQAMAGAEAVARDRRAEAKTADAANNIVAELQEKLARQSAELEEVRRTQDLRKSSYSMGELTERMNGAAGITQARSKEFYGRLLTKNANGRLWHREFGDLKPADVLIRGAFEAKPQTFSYQGFNWTVRAMAPVTAGADDGVLRDAQDASDVLYTWMLWKQARGEHYGSLRESMYFEAYERAMNELERSLLGKAAMTATSLANWVPTGWSARLVERMELERNLSRFIPFEQMTQNPQRIHARGSYLTVYQVTPSTSNPEDATAITSSAVNPINTTLSLHNFAIRAVFDITAEEDTIPSLVPNLIDDIGRSWAYSLEDAILNSDSASFHQDVDITASDDYRKTWDGLRAMAVDQSYNSNSLATLTDTAVISTLVAAMGKYGARPTRRICIVGPKARAHLKTLKTAGNDPVIIGSASPAPIPTAVSGIMLEQLDGSPLITVESARENLNASGFYDGTTTSKGTVMWVFPEGFVLAARNQVGRTVTNFETKTAQHEVMLYQRYEFEDVLPIADHHTIELGVNMTV